MAQPPAITPWNQIAGNAPLARIPLETASDSDVSSMLAKMPMAASPQPVPAAPIPRVTLAATPPSPIQQQIAHDQAKLEGFRMRDVRPWGFAGAAPSAEFPQGLAPNHPGTMGKIAHVLSVAGNIAGDIFAPRVMANIPGTQMNRELQERGLANRVNTEVGQESENENRDALTGKTLEETAEEPANDAAHRGLESAQTSLTGDQAALYSQAQTAMNSPEIKNAFATLSDPAATPEARRTAMATISQSPIAMLPMLRGEMTGAENIYREGETGSRIGGKNIIPDPNSPTGYSTLQYDRFGNVMGLLPVEPSANGQLLLGPQGPRLMGREIGLAGGKAAATQAQGLIPIYDQNSRVIGYASKGGVADATGAGHQGVLNAESGGLNPKPGTTVIEQAQNAVSLQNMIHDNILPAITSAEQAGDMGPASGRVEEFLRQHIGNPDSPAARLQAQLAAVPMMLGRMYGYRSAEYLQGMEGFLNLRMTPTALTAYLSGVSAHARTIAQQGGMGPKEAHGNHRNPGSVTGGTETYTMNGHSYNIPPDKVAAMLKKYPQLKKVK